MDGKLKIKYFISFIILLVLISCSNANTPKNKFVRFPAVKGMFYDANKKNLTKQIKFYLNKSKKIVLHNNERIYGIIVPHAGYRYSGSVLGSAYKQILNKKYDTIIILGVSHRYPLTGISVYPKGYYQIPTRKIYVDKNFVNELKLFNKNIKYIPKAHIYEHSIEVQLPFLKYSVKNNFKIVPILVGQIDLNQMIELADTIIKVIKNHTEKNILIIASSDLSHYPAYNDAVKVDKQTIKLISEFKVKELIKREKNIKNSGINYLVTYQCGLYPVSLFLKIMKKLGAFKNKLLKYNNSGDITGEKERVVGYMSMMFTGKNNEKQNGFFLTDDEKKYLLDLSRKVLNSYITNREIPDVVISDEKLKQKCGAFVTLNKNHNLRGCIGYIEPIKPLYQSVIDNTINAAVNDPRFPNVTAEELKDISIEISVLTPPEKVNSYNDIQIGKHGIILTKGFHTAVFLPQVAPEQGWDLETTLMHLSLKAGLDANAWKSGSEFKVFTAIVFSEDEL